MVEVAKNIYIGKEEEITDLSLPEWGVVNLASTFHYKFHKWERGEDHKKDPCYVIHQEESMISLNWVDGPKHLYDWEGRGVENFGKILNFIFSQRLKEKKVLIVCNQGISRSPTVALLYLAKRLHAINDESYFLARMDFEKIYPFYKPSGIGQFVSENWSSI